MSIDASGTRYWTGHGGVVLVNDPLDTIHDVARAYDIRWLVLERGDAVPAVAPILDGGPLPAWLGEPILAEGSPTAAGRLPRAGDAMTRREAVLSAVGIFAVAFVVRVVFASQIVFPKPEDTAYYVGRRPEPARGPRARLRCPVELRDAAARVPAPGVRGLAAAPELPGRDPDGSPRHDVRGGPVVVGHRRGDRAGPGLAARRRRREGTRASHRPRPDARDRDRADRRGLPAAPPPLGAPRLDDAVRGPRPGVVPGHVPHRRRSTRRPPDRPARHRPGRAHRPCRADPQRGGLPRSRLAHRRLGHPRPRPGDTGPAHRHGRGRGRPGLPALGDPRLGRVRQPVPRPGPDQRPVGHRLRHLRLERPADPVALPRRGSRAPGRDAGRGPQPQPLQRPPPDRAADLAHRA